MIHVSKRNRTHCSGTRGGNVCKAVMAWSEAKPLSTRKCTLLEAFRPQAALRLYRLISLQKGGFFIYFSKISEFLLRNK